MLSCAEELVAFLQMKNVLISMFNRGENALARAKVQQISTVWQERHKVRSKISIAIDLRWYF